MTYLGKLLPFANAANGSRSMKLVPKDPEKTCNTVDVV